MIKIILQESKRVLLNSGPYNISKETDNYKLIALFT